MTEAVIIGAGLGGLCAAIGLQARGVTVRVVEAQDRGGGKAGCTLVDGLEIDTGPSVLTIPRVFDRVFQWAGSSLEAELNLVPLDPAFRYEFPGNIRVEMKPEKEDTLANIEAALDRKARDEFARFLAYAEKIWEVGAPHFVFGAAPTLTSVMRMSLGNLGAVAKIDGLRSMWKAITAHVTSEPLQWILARYATYNGSNPLTAPATLNCIAHVEITEGGFGIEGGMRTLVERLQAAAERLGVEFQFGTRVERIRVEGGRIAGLETDRGFVRSRVVVANCEADQVFRDLLASSPVAPSTEEPSMSGWNAIVRTRTRADRAPHTVLFPRAYLEEFRDVFDRRRPPHDPTVYICAPRLAHRKPTWGEDEPLFVMVNAPPERESTPASVWDRVETIVLQRLKDAGLVEETPSVVWRRTPADLARQFPGSRGSIYGASSNSTLAAFRRPENRVRKLPGLYLASGSAHPGGGMPLAAQSGINAALLAGDDLERPRLSERPT